METIKNTQPKPVLVFLPGALGASADFDFLIHHLQAKYTCVKVDYPGHAHAELPEKMDSDSLLKSISKQIADCNDGTAIAFGYSMGGYLAMLGLLRGVLHFSSVITLGTKLVWDEKTATKEMSFLQPEVIEQKVPQFASLLHKKHGSEWKTVCTLTADFLQELGKNNYLTCEALGKIEQPVKLMIGDRDRMAGLQDTVSLYSCLQKGALAVLPNTEHALEKVNLNTFLPQFQ